MTADADRAVYSAAMGLAAKHRELGGLRALLATRRRDVWEQSANDNCSVTERRETVTYAVTDLAAAIADAESELEALKVEYDVAKLLRLSTAN